MRKLLNPFCLCVLIISNSVSAIASPSNSLSFRDPGGTGDITFTEVTTPRASKLDAIQSVHTIFTNNST
ncbi:MAG: hypothetical protein AAFQ98_23685, partial [Bacteroidota bacterium]